MAESAGAIAEMTGLGKTFIGSTLVAFCTSLPELVSTIAAVRMGAFDLAVGNIFGSNSFNMILLVPLDWLHPGNLLGSISRSHVLTALGVILATSVAVMGQLYHEEKRKKIIEPDALAIIAVVIGALYVLYWVGGT
jgi:cation:H+ antiporter